MVILIICSLFFGCIGYLKHRRIDNPLTVFSILWALVFFLYSLKLYNYFDISTRTWMVLLTQTFGFSLGCLFRDIIKIVFKKKKIGNELCRSENGLFRPAVYILCLITIAFLFAEVVSILGYLSSGLTYEDIAHQGLSNESSATGVRVFINIFIVFPMVYGISAITAAEMFCGNKCKLLILFNIIIIAMYAIQHGGRHLLIVLVTSYLFAYINSNKHSKLNKKQRRWVLTLCIVGVTFALVLSALRGIENIGMSLYHYYACCIPNLDQWISRITDIGEYTFGFTSLNGFISPIIILLRGIGLISDTPRLYQQANNYISGIEQLTTIGYGVETNAFVGLSYTFYVDGGIIFVLLGTFVYGYMCMDRYIAMREENDCKARAIYFLLVVTVIMSFTRFQFFQYFYAMALVMINLVYRREKIKK